MQRIGRYELLLELGRGAMGAVYQARDPQIDRVVAIKVILTQGLSNQELENYKQRFYREARAAGKMSHPGIVTIHDIAEDEAGHPYLVMEFIEGTTLEDMVEQRLASGEKLPFPQALDIGMQVANALDYAHKRGVVHRDVKPANVLVTQEGLAKIADFGIAKMSGVSMTQTGSFLGTPAFMSPEQFSGGAIDARSDLFSLGAMLYWMFTGEQPFGGESLTTVSFRIVFTYPIPASQVNTALPPEIDTVLMRCLAKNPEERYASCKDLAADLEAIKHGQPIKATPLPVKEQTIVNAPVVTAAPLGAVSAGGTVALPPDASPTGTVAVPPPKPPSQATTVVDRTIALPKTAPPPTEKRKGRAVLAWFRSRRLMAAAAAVILLALVAGGIWLWPEDKSAASKAAEKSEPAERRATEPPPPVPAREGEREESGPPPWAKASSKARRSRPVGPMATLVIDCRHNFKDGTLEVLMDGSQLVTLAMRGEVRNLGVIEIASGTVRRTVSVPAGQHVFRVKARANRGDYQAEEEIGGTFSKDGTRILLVEFGAGSGLKVVDRKLTLSWK